MIFFQIFDFYAINSTVIFIIRIFGLFGFLFNLVILSLFKVTRVLLEYYSSNGYSSNGYSSNTFFVTLLGYSSNTFPVTLLEVSSNAFRYSSTTLHSAHPNIYVYLGCDARPNMFRSSLPFL